MYKIVVDCFGGDLSPKANVAGAVQALNAESGFNLILVGDKDKINAELAQLKYDSERLEIVHASEVITCEEQPTVAIKSKTDSSMVKSFEELKNGADALVSIGSTGALLTGSVLKVGRIKGVLRPALAPILPTMKGGQVVMLDAGANADCKPPYLVHFAIMGSVYASEILKIKNPRVALLSNGTEDAKGNELTKEVHGLLRECKHINFVGNIEAREILSGDCDVVVTDGFSGNIALKGMEGVSGAIFGKMMEEVNKSFKAKIGALLMKPALRAVKNTLDYNKKGGAVFLGISKTIIKSHGSSKDTAICAAILQAKRACEGNIVDAIKSKLDAISQSENGENA